jgi:hypothetical protein
MMKCDILYNISVSANQREFQVFRLIKILEASLIIHACHLATKDELN